MNEDGKYLAGFFDATHSGFSEGKIFATENNCLPSTIKLIDTYDIYQIIDVYTKLVPLKMKKYEQYYKFIANNLYVESGMIPIRKDIIISLFSSIRDIEDNLAEANFSESNIGNVAISYSTKSEARVLRFIKKIERFKKSLKKDARCNIIAYSSSGGFYLKNFKIVQPEFDMELNYGGELLEKDRVLKEKISTKVGGGLVLLHGKAGAGKTNYIRHLIFYLSNINKLAIYVPPALVPRLSEPDFISFMMKNQNAVLIIEDAESIVSSRESNINSEGVHNLLNMADGLLGEAMGVQVICTFNTKIEKIDGALKRKGRIIIEHEFGELSQENAQKLSDSLGYETIIKKSMTLADIYNQEDMDFSDKERESVGFKK